MTRMKCIIHEVCNSKKKKTTHAKGVRDVKFIEHVVHMRRIQAKFSVTRCVCCGVRSSDLNLRILYTVLHLRTHAYSCVWKKTEKTFSISFIVFTRSDCVYVHEYQQVSAFHSTSVACWVNNALTIIFRLFCFVVCV